MFNNLYGQDEIESLYEHKLRTNISEQNVKSRTTFKKMNGKFEDIRYEYFSNNGQIDSIVEVNPMWCNPCSMDEKGKLYKGWQTRQINSLSNKENKVENILHNLEKSDFFKDTSEMEHWKSYKNFKNSVNRFEFYQTKDETVILKTIYKYDEKYNITVKVEYRNYDTSFGTTKHNASNITFYEYNKHGYRIQELEEYLDTNRQSITTYEYNKKNLLIRMSKYNQEYIYQYEYY